MTNVQPPITCWRGAGVFPHPSRRPWTRWGWGPRDVSKHRQEIVQGVKRRFEMFCDVAKAKEHPLEAFGVWWKDLYESWRRYSAVGQQASVHWIVIVTVSYINIILLAAHFVMVFSPEIWHVSLVCSGSVFRLWCKRQLSLMQPYYYSGKKLWFM